MDSFNEFFLDTLGQQPGLKLYTQITLCFSVPDDTAQSTIVAKLTYGLEKLAAAFPWTAGQVVIEGASEHNSGLFKVVPLERIPRLIVKDRRHDASIPTMEEMRQAGFPFRMLDENVVAPVNTLPAPAPESPVFLVQANLIKGGLLLTFVGQHNTMDMVGQGELIDLLSQACHGHEIPKKALEIGNLDRRRIVSQLNEAEQRKFNIENQLLRAAPEAPESQKEAPVSDTPPAPTVSPWTYFIFDAKALSEIKSLAMESISSGYVSTDDSLCAFIWQAVSRARLVRLSPSSKSTFARAVDARRYLGVADKHPGLLQNMAYHTWELQKVVDAPLGQIAAEFRAAVDPVKSDIGDRTRALITLLENTPDKNTVSVTAAVDLDRDFMLSSWVKQDFYEIDFNLGFGRPEAVRRPQFVAFPSLSYLMPRKPNGEIALAICLQESDMQRLRADEVFMNYTKLVV